LEINIIGKSLFGKIFVEQKLVGNQYLEQNILGQMSIGPSDHLEQIIIVEHESFVLR